MRITLDGNLDHLKEGWPLKMVNIQVNINYNAIFYLK